MTPEQKAKGISASRLRMRLMPAQDATRASLNDVGDSRRPAISRYVDAPVTANRTIQAMTTIESSSSGDPSQIHAEASPASRPRPHGPRVRQPVAALRQITGSGAIAPSIASLRIVIL